MSLDSVVEDIREQARAEAEAIREAAKEEAAEIIEEAEQEASQLIEQAKEGAERDSKQLREQQLSSANLEAKQLRLEARREVLDEVREKVEERLVALGSDEREALTKTLLEAALDEFGDDEALTVHGRESDEDLLAELVSDDDRLSVGDPVDRLGGIVVEGTSTRLRVDNTFDAVLNEVWDDRLRSISDELFEE